LGGKLIAFIKALLLKHFCQSTRQQQKPQALRWSAIVAVQSNCYAAPAQNWQYIAQQFRDCIAPCWNNDNCLIAIKIQSAVKSRNKSI
jgi:hypothetical protein